jgi:hypothetical protein
MMRSAKALIGYAVEATDGIAGRVVDALFDDLSWTTVYVLLEVGQALTPRRVLISLSDIEYAGWTEHKLRVSWTRRQLEDRPGPNSGHPESGPQADATDLHLRSMRDMMGYTIQGRDGRIGRVADLLIDDGSWALVSFLVETGEWWPGEKVFISPGWVRILEPGERVVLSGLDRRTVREGPAFRAQEQWLG